MSKRINGEGTIYLRKDGRWCAILSHDGGKRKFFYGKTRQDVALQLADAIHDQGKGIPVVRDDWTVGAFLESWLSETVKNAVQPRTYQSYEQIVNLYLIPFLGKIPLTKLTPMHVQAMMNTKVGDGLSSRSIGYIRAVLRQALNAAVKWELVVRNVATLVDPPHATPKEIQPFSPDEARQFIRAIREDRHEALFLIALTMGLRQGEVLGLRWEDVNIADGLLSVRHALTRIEGNYYLAQPKTKSSKRTIPIPQRAKAALIAHKQHQLDAKVRLGDKWHDEGLVFTTEFGFPLHGSTITHYFHDLLDRNSLRQQRFHDLRHACASLLLEQGVSARVVMELLGHSQITLTLNTYSHVTPSLLNTAAQQMDALLGDE